MYETEHITLTLHLQVTRAFGWWELQYYAANYNITGGNDFNKLISRISKGN